MSRYADDNPKDAAAGAEDRAPLDLLEPAADEAVARALGFGAEKYGVRNYTQVPIRARVYIAAMRRHLAAWLDGEDYASDSGLHHLAHVGANVHVAMAAMAAGTFIDDRHAATAREDQLADSIDAPANVDGA